MVSESKFVLKKCLSMFFNRNVGIFFRWQTGELTNFAYLTELNKQACRSFNDLMQYPVFPLVLADYKCDVLDLTDVTIYRWDLNVNSQ